MWSQRSKKRRKNCNALAGMKTIFQTWLHISTALYTVLKLKSRKKE